MTTSRADDKRGSEVRLFLEEVCCDLCRFRHAADLRIAPEEVHIQQEVFLGLPGAFADIRVSVPGEPAYFVEVKYGYPPERIVAHLVRRASRKWSRSRRETSAGSVPGSSPRP